MEYALGGSTSQLGACSATSAPSGSNSDLTGRLRALRVGRGTSAAYGAVPADVYERVYQWQADQVVRIDSCTLGEAARTETFAYDGSLRLRSAGRAGQTVEGQGGPYTSRAWDYDRRGNRTLSTLDALPGGQGPGAQVMTYDPAGRGRLTTMESPFGTTSSYTLGAYKKTWTYDVDGRATSMKRASAHLHTYGYAFDSSVSTGTVFKSFTRSGATYEYFYDARGRRRAKLYPDVSMRDEYFYSPDNLLLVDQGVDAGAFGTRPLDEYVWLGGRPVAIVRGGLDPNWQRRSDATSTCVRPHDISWPACGIYFPVTDHIGKVVLILDMNGRVSGVFDYDAHGHRNRVNLFATTPSPYLDNVSVTLATLDQKTALKTRYRVRTAAFDSESNADYLQIYDGDTAAGTALLSGKYSGAGKGWSVTSWVAPASGRATVMFHAGPAGATANTYRGVALEGYEYHRMESGARIFSSPLRFPGQHYDAESHLHENWNRYYDPSTGNYLQSEPMLAIGPMTLPVYSYALNNPVTKVDRTGFDPGDPFGTPFEAAMDARNFMYGPNGPLLVDSVEYIGLLYRNVDGTFSYTAPETSFLPGKVSTPRLPCPGEVVGDYHNHPEGSTLPSLTDLRDNQRLDTMFPSLNPGYMSFVFQRTPNPFSMQVFTPKDPADRGRYLRDNFHYKSLP